MPRCLRCPNDTTALHGLCPACITADAIASRQAQGLPATIPADDDVFARIDAITRPATRETAA